MIFYRDRIGPSADGQAKLVVVAKEGDPSLVELERIPKNDDGSSAVLFRGRNFEEFSTPEGKQALKEANVLLNCGGEEESEEGGEGLFTTPGMIYGKRV